MKHKLLRMSLLLCALIAGSSVWADTKELTFNMSSNPGEWPTANSTTLTDYTYTLNEVDYTFALKNVKCNSGYLMLTATAALGLPAIDGYKLTKVEATNSGGCSTSTKVGISSSSSEAKYVSGGGIQTWATTNTKYTYNLTETSVNTMYYMYVTNKNAQVVSLTLTYETDVPVNEETFSYVDYQGWANSPDYGKEITMSKTDVDITNNWFYTPQGYSYIQFTATNGTGTITITPKNDATITKVEFIVSAEYNGYQNSQTIIPSTGTVSKNEEGTIVTWTGSATSAFTLRYNSHIHWTSIKVYYTGGLPRCATPVITGETPFLTYSTVTITCDTSGALIEYCTSTDGVTYTPYKPYPFGGFQISTSTTVKARATKDGLADSKEAYKAFTQQGSVANIGMFISTGVASQYLELHDALVTYKNGNTAYLQDAYGAIMLYKCVGDDLAAGDKLNGYMHVTGYTPSYNGLPEITGFELVEGYTKTSGNTVTPTVVTLAQLMDDPESSPYEMYLSKYVKIENATVTSAFASKNCTIEQGGYSIILRDQNSSATLTTKKDDVVTVTGHVAIYNTTKQIALYEQSQIVVSEAPVVPTITVTPSSLTGLTYVVDNGPSAAQTITVSGTNLTADITLTLSTTDYEMSLTEANGYANSLTLTQSAGTVAATTVYVRLKAGLEKNSYNASIAITSTDASSKSVTLAGSVTEYVPDYATLPFSFDKGKADIENTGGLSQDGLGSDYGSSPYLKFDGTGDYLILKFNERPGVLTFDIKGNGFSDGTFTVQTSEDGVTYSDLKAYTELSSTQNESFDNLGENVRYIKWIYTAKDNGNVALGNIALAKYVAPSLDPVITVSPTTVETSAAGADGTITVTYKNITTVVAEVEFYESDGTTKATYDWIQAEIDKENNVYYVIDANTGAVRTAYLKVYALDDDANDVYSELITISQAEYVDPASVASVTLDFTDAAWKFPTDYVKTEASYTNGGYTITLGASSNGHKKLTSGTNITGIIFGKKDATLTLPAFDFNVSKIKVSGISGASGKVTYNVLVGSDEVSTEVTGATGVYEFAIATDKQDAGTIYTIKLTNDNNCQISKIEVFGYVPVTVGASGYTTFWTNNAKAKGLSYSGVKAYVVTAINTDNVSLEEITEAPAWTPVIIEATEGVHNLAVIPSATAVTTNLLQASRGANTAGESTDSYYFALAKKDNGIGFYKIADGITIPDGKAYLEAPKGSSIKEFLGFNDDPDGINSLTPALSEGEGAIYNLAGQRLQKMQKGINIVNGKKVLK